MKYYIKTKPFDDDLGSYYVEYHLYQKRFLWFDKFIKKSFESNNIKNTLSEILQLEKDIEDMQKENYLNNNP